MIVEGRHYDPVSYGGQGTRRTGGSPIVCNYASGTSPYSKSGQMLCGRCEQPSQRPPCCCEVMRNRARLGRQHQQRRPQEHHYHPQKQTKQQQQQEYYQQEYQQQHQPYQQHQQDQKQQQQPHQNLQEQPHQQHQQQQQQQQQEYEGQVPPRHHSSSRRCFCCVPEREELQECERMEKEHRYRSMRAERQQLQAALYDDLRRGEIREGTSAHPRASRRCYRPNTSHLLRYSQRLMYQQAAEMEQERRRQELRREIEARKRELSARGTLYHALPSTENISSIGATRVGAATRRPRGRGFTYVPVTTTICGTENLKHHYYINDNQQQQQQQPPPLIVRGASALRGGSSGRSHSHRYSTRKTDVPQVNKEITQSGQQSESARVPKITDPITSTNRTGNTITQSPSRCRCGCEKEKRSSSLPLRGGGKNESTPSCCCCSRHPCHCQPCNCCKIKSDSTPAADVMDQKKSITENKGADKATETLDETDPSRPNRLKKERTVSPQHRSQPTAVEHGRKIYITDDAYLSRRSQIIERLEKDGYVRCIEPTTRSPSAPLPEKTRKWETTRSTSAHRVCL